MISLPAQRGCAPARRECAPSRRECAPSRRECAPARRECGPSQREGGSSPPGDACPADPHQHRLTTFPRTVEVRVLMDVQKGLTTLLVMTAVAAIAPFVCALFARIRLPQVVVFIVGGVLIGPEVLAWAEPDEITLIANVGLGFLFLLAGYELDLELF